MPDQRGGKVSEEAKDELTQHWELKIAGLLMSINNNLKRIADGMDVARRIGVIEDKLDHMLTDVHRVLKLEVKQMAFTQDVLDRITRQTTLIGSIKTWIQSLPANEVSEESKAAILAALDANQSELETALPANTPSDPNA